MKTMYKKLLLLLFIPGVLMASEKKKWAHEETKTVTKEYDVNSDAVLNISNRYGNVDIASWDENRVSIKVTITVKGKKESKVLDRLDQINIEFDGSRSEVTAKTKIGKSNSWGWGNNNNLSMEINYLVKMPVSNSLNVSNDYGAIFLDDLDGSANISCDYGKINIGELRNMRNNINMDYTNKSTIEFMKNGDINADYSTLHVEKGGNMDLNADYSHMSFGEINSLEFNSDYGDLKVESVEKIDGNSDYMHLSIGSLGVLGSFNSDYGSIKIKKVSKDISNLTIKTSYANIKLGIEDGANFDFAAEMSYSGFSHGDGFTFNKQIEKNTSKYYEGYFGSANSGNMIKLETSYGGINLSNY